MGGLPDRCKKIGLLVQKLSFGKQDKTLSSPQLSTRGTPYCGDAVSTFRYSENTEALPAKTVAKQVLRPGRGAGEQLPTKAALLNIGAYDRHRVMIGFQAEAGVLLATGSISEFKTEHTIQDYAALAAFADDQVGRGGH